MFRKIGIVGIFGVLLAILGLGVLAYVEPLIAVGVALILVGMGVVLGNLLRRMLATFGMGGMF